MRVDVPGVDDVPTRCDRGHVCWRTRRQVREDDRMNCGWCELSERYLADVGLGWRRFPLIEITDPAEVAVVLLTGALTGGWPAAEWSE